MKPVLAPNQASLTNARCLALSAAFATYLAVSFAAAFVAKFMSIYKKFLIATFG
jgi:hypothetical protein